MASSEEYQQGKSKLRGSHMYQRVIWIITWLWHQDYRNRATCIALESSGAFSKNLWSGRIIEVSGRPCDLRQPSRHIQQSVDTNLVHVPSLHHPVCRAPSLRRSCWRLQWYSIQNAYVDCSRRTENLMRHITLLRLFYKWSDPSSVSGWPTPCSSNMALTQSKMISFHTSPIDFALLILQLWFKHWSRETKVLLSL